MHISFFLTPCPRKTETATQYNANWAGPWRYVSPLLLSLGLELQLGPRGLGPHPSYEMHHGLINLAASFKKINLAVIPNKIGGCSNNKKLTCKLIGVTKKTEISSPPPLISAIFFRFITYTDVSSGL
jgi:hypothetical protein